MAGYTADELSSLRSYADEERRRRQVMDQLKKRAGKQPSGTKKFLVNAGAIAASTAAGIGAIAAAPVTGGVSLAGGFAAGAGIEALRRKMLGEQQSLGADLIEGGLTVIPGSGLLKGGGKAAMGAARAGGKALTTDVAMQAGVPTMKNLFKNATTRTAEIVPKTASKKAAAAEVTSAAKPVDSFDTATVFNKPKTNTGWTRDAEIGISPNRGTSFTTIDQTHPYYETPRSKGFENSLLAKAPERNLGDPNIQRSAGFWEGSLEPSHYVKTTGKTNDILSYASEHGKAMNQDAVMVFMKGTGKDARYTFTVKDPAKAADLLTQNGISGASIVGNQVHVIDMGGGLRDNIANFAKQVKSKPDVATGKAHLLEKEKGHYDQYLNPSPAPATAGATPGGGDILPGRASAPGTPSAIGIEPEIVPSRMEQFGENFADMFKPKKTGFMGKTGGNMRGNSRGIFPGAKVGSTELGVADARSMNAAVDDALRANLKTDGATAKAKSVMPKSAVGELEAVEKQRDALGQQIRDAIGEDNVALDANRKAILGAKIQDRLRQIPDFDMTNPAHVSLVNNMMRQLDVGDLHALEAGRRNIDELINYSRSSATADPFKERIAEALRHGTDEFVTEISPASKQVKNAYASLTKATDFMKRASAEGVKPFGMSGGVIPTLSARGPIGKTYQAAEDASGKTLQGADRLLHTPAVRNGAINFGGNALIYGNPLDRGGDDTPLTDEETNVLTSPADWDQQELSTMFGGTVDDGSGGELDPAAQDTGPTSNDLFNMAMEAFNAGDIKSSDQYMQMATFKASQEKTAAASGGSGSGNGLNITKVTAQQYGLAQSGAGALQQLAAMIQENPSVITRTATPGRGLPIVGGFVSNAAGTGEFDAIGYNIADSILRLRTGAQANESEVKKLQTQIMPRAGDSQQTIQTKLAQIQQIFDGVLKTAGTPTTGSDFGNFQDVFGQQQLTGAY